MDDRPDPGLFRTPGYPWLWIVTLLLGSGYGVTLSSQASFWEEAAFDSRAIAFIGMANGLGILIGYLIAGLTSDRRSKRSLVRNQSLTMAGLSAITVALAIAFGLEGESFYLLAALFGLAHGSAYAVIVGWTAELLPRALIAKGVIVMTLAGYAQSTLTAFPGVFFRGDPNAVVWVFAIACLLYLLAAVAARKVPARGPSPTDKSALSELRLAMSYLWNDARLKALWLYALIASVIMLLLEGAILELLWVEHGFREWDYTLPLLLRGAAYFVASLAFVFLVGGRRRWSLFIGAAVVLGLTVSALAVSSALEVLALLMVLIGLASPIVLLGYQALALSVSRSTFFGKVAALMLFANSLLNFGAGFLRPQLYDLISGRNAVLVFGLLLMLLAAWFYRRWRRFRDVPEDPDATVRDTPMSLLVEVASPQKSGEPNQSA